MCARKRVLVALAQGSGKTVISIAAVEKLIELKLAVNVLVLCQASTDWQWQEKIEEFTDHGDVRVVRARDGTEREYCLGEATYTVLPYSVFRKDYKKLPKYDIIIADEAQEFSSFRSTTFKLVKKLKSPYKWAMTGTAISNKLEELYAIIEWVDPYCLPYWKRFEKLHIVRNPKTKQILKYKNIKALNKYLLATRMVRKTSKELDGQLPKLIPNKKYIEKTKEVRHEEKELYASLKASKQRNFRFDPKVSSGLHSARQIISSSKLERARTLCTDIINECESNRVVVFNFYKQPLYNLQSSLPSVLFTGDQSSEEKRAAVQAFRSGEAKVLICSNAGSAGLDLPFANYVIHLDVPFSHGVMDQRSKRIQRTSSIFQTVNVIYLLAKDSIDEYYYKVVINKSKLAQATLEGGDDSIVMRDISLKDYLAKFYD